MMKVKLILLITLICLPSLVFSQSKPTRDKAKDRSSVSVHRPSNRKSKVTAKATTPRNTSTKKHGRSQSTSRRSYSKRLASYLSVNQHGYLQKNYGASYGYETFYVYTDGKEWATAGVPSWCSVSKYSDRFTLTYNSNPNHEKRSDFFYVISDDQRVRIDITQDGAPLNISVSFNSTNLSHNVYGYTYGVNSSQCLMINTNFTIQGAKGQKCLLVAFVLDDSYHNISASYGYSDYRLQSGDVCVVSELTPTTDSPQTYNYSLLLPNQAMRLINKKNKLMCLLRVYCTTTSDFVPGYYYTSLFNARVKKGRVETEP